MSRRIALFAVIASCLTAAPALAQNWTAGALRVLKSGQQMPRSAEIRKSTCVAKVRVSVDSNGMITRYAIEKPCADPILTRATDDLFFKVGQLPPPPLRKPGSFDLDIVWPPKG